MNWAESGFPCTSSCHTESPDVVHVCNADARVSSSPSPSSPKGFRFGQVEKIQERTDNAAAVAVPPWWRHVGRPKREALGGVPPEILHGQCYTGHHRDPPPATGGVPTSYIRLLSATAMAREHPLSFHGFTADRALRRDAGYGHPAVGAGGAGQLQPKLPGLLGTRSH